MFIKSVKTENENWKFCLDRETPVFSLSLKVSEKKFRKTCSVFVDDCFFFFALYSHCDGSTEINYVLSSQKSGVAQVEKGSFRGFDSVSAEFRGIRFHWNRESGKIVISDAFAGRRDFESLTIE